MSLNAHIQAGVNCPFRSAPFNIPSGPALEDGLYVGRDHFALAFQSRSRDPDPLGRTSFFSQRLSIHYSPTLSPEVIISPPDINMQPKSQKGFFWTRLRSELPISSLYSLLRPTGARPFVMTATIFLLPVQVAKKYMLLSFLEW